MVLACLVAPLTGASQLDSNITPPSTQDTHHHLITLVFPPHCPISSISFSHGPIFSPFSLSTVPDMPPDHTFQPDMNQREVEKDRGLWGRICTKFKIFCERHKRERPLGQPPSVGQSILAILKTSCGPLRPLAPPSQSHISVA